MAMDPSSPTPQPERRQTDQSLRNEREKTDQQRLAKEEAIADDAATVVDRARDVADGVLRGARDKADQRLEDSQAPVRARESVERERVQEDRALQRERAMEDQTVDEERGVTRRVMSSLLRLEREVTDRSLLTERNRSDAALDTRDGFLGMVSHDLRTLLAGIALNVEILVKIPPEGEVGTKTQKTAQAIHRITTRMNRLIGDLVDVAAIEAGKPLVAPRRSDAAGLLREAVDAFQPAAVAKGISLDANIASDPLLAHVDPERVVQVLANLVSNAIKFTSSGGRISIRAEPAGEEVRFSVADTGAGIPGDKLEAVFERFWQVNQSDRRGLGLGLYISRCLVEAHGGRIWAESEEGVGSTFYFTLPSAAPSVE